MCNSFLPPPVMPLNWDTLGYELFHVKFFHSKSCCRGLKKYTVPAACIRLLENQNNPTVVKNSKGLFYLKFIDLERFYCSMFKMQIWQYLYFLNHEIWSFFGRFMSFVLYIGFFLIFNVWVYVVLGQYKHMYVLCVRWYFDFLSVCFYKVPVHLEIPILF